MNNSSHVRKRFMTTNQIHPVQHSHTSHSNASQTSPSSSILDVSALSETPEPCVLVDYLERLKEAPSPSSSILQFVLLSSQPHHSLTVDVQLLVQRLQQSRPGTLLVIQVGQRTCIQTQNTFEHSKLMLDEACEFILGHLHVCICQSHIS